MAQNKLEKDFSKKLNERQIQPSPMAWDRLDAMLSVAEEKKPVKNYNWMYLAASILGFLFIGTMLFTQTSEVVDQGKTEVVIENQKENLNPIITKPEIINPAQNPTEIVLQPKKSSIKTITKEALPVIANQNRNQINQKQQVNQQTETVIAQVEAQNNPKNEQKITKSTYVNVDELLASVDKNPKSKEATVKIDANGLLSQVDGELELSFREKVIKTVNKNYKTVRVALANRNIQE